MRYAPTGGASTAAGQLLLENYIQGVDSDVNIAGTDSTTPYGSLQPALGAIKIATTIPAIHQLLITEAGEHPALKSSGNSALTSILAHSTFVPTRHWSARRHG